MFLNISSILLVNSLLSDVINKIHRRVRYRLRMRVHVEPVRVCITVFLVRSNHICGDFARYRQVPCMLMLPEMAPGNSSTRRL